MKDIDRDTFYKLAYSAAEKCINEDFDAYIDIRGCKLWVYPHLCYKIYKERYFPANDKRGAREEPKEKVIEYAALWFTEHFGPKYK